MTVRWVFPTSEALEKELENKEYENFKLKSLSAGAATHGI